MNQFDCDEDNYFLELLRERPCFWNKSSAEYHDAIIRDNSLREKSRKLQIDVTAVKEKINKFMTAYKKEKELREKESNKSGAAPSRRIKWPYFETMHNFIVQHEIPRSTLSNLSDTPVRRNPRRSDPVKLTNLIDQVGAKVYSLSNPNQIACSTSTSISTHEDVEALVGKLVLIKLNELSPTEASTRRKAILEILLKSAF